MQKFDDVVYIYQHMTNQVDIPNEINWWIATVLNTIEHRGT